MTDAALHERFEFASRLIEEAGDLALGYFRRLDTLTIETKGHQDMASEADFNTEMLIRNRLKSRFPDDAFLGEETGRGDVAGSRGIWVVDPIDGTQAFISGMTNWCISIAYVRDGVVELGLVNSPARNERFAGRRGGSATLNGQKIRVGEADGLGHGMLGVGYSPRVPPDTFLPIFSRLIRQGAMYYRDGSGALMLCYVACGRLIGYIEAHINSWDCLGALAIIEAAGGMSNDFLANDGLWKGNRLAAGPVPLYPTLIRLFDPQS